MISQILNITSIYSVFIPIIIGVKNYSRLDTNAKVLLLLLAFASIPHVATSIYGSKSLPYVYYNGYILIEALLWPLIFILSIKSPFMIKLYFILWVANLSTPIIYLSFNDFFNKFYSQLVCFNSFFQIIFIILFFYEINRRNVFITLKREPMLWFCTGLLFYSTCTFFLFLFYKKINSYMTKSELNILWQIHNIFNILMYLLFSLGLSIKKFRSYV